MKILESQKKKIAVIDIGYNGTLQANLSKVLGGVDIYGYYFSTFTGVRDNLKEGTYDSFHLNCFDNKNNSSFFSNNIALFEYLLSQGEASVEKYSSSGEPIYMQKSEVVSKYKFEFQGDLIDQLSHVSPMNIIGDDIFSNIDNKVINELVNGLLGDYIEDNYGGKSRRYILYSSENPVLMLIRSEWKYGIQWKLNNSIWKYPYPFVSFLSKIPELIYFKVRRLRFKYYAAVRKYSKRNTD